MLMESRFGMNDTYIGHGGLGQDASDIASFERLLERLNVIELDNLRGARRIYRRADIAGAGLGYAILQSDERFVDGAVIAPVEDQDLGTSGNLTSEPNGKPICVRGTECELPVRQAEALLQFFANPYGI